MFFVKEVCDGNCGKLHRSSDNEGCSRIEMDCSTGEWEKGEMLPDRSETEICERLKFSKAL